MIAHDSGSGGFIPASQNGTLLYVKNSISFFRLKSSSVMSARAFVRSVFSWLFLVKC